MFVAAFKGLQSSEVSHAHLCSRTWGAVLGLLSSVFLESGTQKALSGWISFIQWVFLEQLPWRGIGCRG